LNLKNKTMEQILAFVLGVGAVAFVWVVVVAFKTVRKLKEIDQLFSGHREWISSNDQVINRRVDQEVDRVNQLVDEVYSTIDSRLDKLEAKITKEQGSKQILKG
jgi:uncharacterized protein YoxC